MGSLIDRDQAEVHDTLYQAASELFTPYFVEGGGRAPASDAEVEEVRRACALFERVLVINPANWNAAWVLGMARRSIGDYVASYEALSRAYALQPGNETVAREHTAACLIIERDDEAVQVADAAVARDPDNAALISNLALAMLFARRLDEAARALWAANQIAPEDPIISRLRMVIGNLANGRFDEAEEFARLFAERAPSDPLTARLPQIVRAFTGNPL